VIPQPPPGAEPGSGGMPAPPAILPRRPDELTAPGPGPKGLPAVDWSFWKALLVGLVTNLLLAQIVVAGVLLVVLGVSSADDTSSGNALIYVSVVSDLAWFVGMLVWLTNWHKGWRERIGIFFGRRGLRDGAFGALGGLILYPVIAIGVGIPLTILFHALSGQETTTPDQLPSNLSTTAAAMSVVLAVLVAPVVEELFFRGIVFRSVRDRRGFWVGAIVSGLLFGLVHYVPAAWQDTLLLQSIMVFTGIGLAWIYERRGNLLANIAAHMAFNTIGIILILSVR
jgi:membrane protease YdiL (CAAX protease family)